ncbi:MAG: hypothetical protein WD065_13405 [Planctomycetaceae bacterium]
MSSNDEILRRLKELEAENAQLRRHINLPGKTETKPTTTHVAMWKGHPVIRFEGAFRPFGLGLRKAAIILEKIDDVRFFVDNNRQHIAGAPDGDEPA